MPFKNDWCIKYNWKKKWPINCRTEGKQFTQNRRISCAVFIYVEGLLIQLLLLFSLCYIYVVAYDQIVRSKPKKKNEQKLTLHSQNSRYFLVSVEAATIKFSFVSFGVFRCAFLFQSFIPIHRIQQFKRVALECSCFGRYQDHWNTTVFKNKLKTVFFSPLLCFYVVNNSIFSICCCFFSLFRLFPMCESIKRWNL